MTKNLRKHVRTRIADLVLINHGRPYQGGELIDISKGGVAVSYPAQTEPASDPVLPGQLIALVFGGGALLPARVVRVFENGFATEFDFSLKVVRDPDDLVNSKVKLYPCVPAQVSV
jgi:hypothetical protein